MARRWECGSSTRGCRSASIFLTICGLRKSGSSRRGRSDNRRLNASKSLTMWELISGSIWLSIPCHLQ